MAKRGDSGAWGAVTGLSVDRGGLLLVIAMGAACQMILRGPTNRIFRNSTEWTLLPTPRLR